MLTCSGGDTDSLASTVSMTGDQQLMFNVNQLIVTVEAGMGNCTIPMILVESKVTGEVRIPSMCSPVACSMILC